MIVIIIVFYELEAHNTGELESNINCNFVTLDAKILQVPVLKELSHKYATDEKSQDAM